jgi:hypothetical protein
VDLIWDSNAQGSLGSFVLRFTLVVRSWCNLLRSGLESTHVDEIDYPVGCLGISSAVSGNVHIALGDKHIVFWHGGTLKYVLFQVLGKSVIFQGTG